MQEMQVPSLHQEDPLEKETATHSSILAWKIPWTEEPGSYSARGHRVGHDLATKQHIASGICFSFHWLPALQDEDGDVGGDEGCC